MPRCMLFSRETCQTSIRHESFLLINDWRATRSASRSIAGCWRCAGDNDRRPFANYYRARHADGQKRRELTGGTETTLVPADHNGGGGGRSGGGSLQDGKNDSAPRGPRGGILEDESFGQPSGGVGTGRGRAPILLFINSPSGHSYVADVTGDTLVGDLRTLVNKRTPPPQAP